MVMKLGRRGFFGLLAGAAVAGPSVAHEVASRMAVNMPLDGLAIPGDAGSAQGMGGGFGMLTTGGGTDIDKRSFVVEELARIVGLTKAQHAERIMNTDAYSLDPDIAGYRSVSLNSKVRMQRARNYWRQHHRQRWSLERALETMTGIG